MIGKISIRAFLILLVVTFFSLIGMGIGGIHVTSPDASHPPRQPSDMSAPLTHPRGAASSTPEQVELWGMDSFPASDPPQNW